MLTRRHAFLGFAAVTAPFVIRTPGLLMPVRNRIIERVQHLGDFIEPGYGMRPIMGMLSTEKMTEIARRIESEKRYKAMRLL